MPFPNPATQFGRGLDPVEMGMRGASKGGKARTLKKKLACMIRWAKEEGFTEERSERIMATMLDPQLDIFDLKKYGSEIKDSIHPSQRVALLNTLISLHKTIHGEKIQLEATHHIFDWTTLLKKIEKDGTESEKTD